MISERSPDQINEINTPTIPVFPSKPSLNQHLTISKLESNETKGSSVTDETRVGNSNDDGAAAAIDVVKENL